MIRTPTPTEKTVKKELTGTPVKTSANGPKKSSDSDKIVNYSDSDDEDDDDKVPEPLDMDVDEDGVPVLPMPAGKRSNEETDAIEHSNAKKAKSDSNSKIVEGAKD